MFLGIKMYTGFTTDGMCMNTMCTVSLANQSISLWQGTEFLKATMNANRLRILCTKIYKTINNLNPNFMRALFNLRETGRLLPEKF